MAAFTTGPRPKPLPSRQAQVTDLAEYRERVDQGDRDCVAMLFDGLGADPVRPMDADEANFVAGELHDLLQGAISVARATRHREPTDLHIWAEAKVREIKSQLAQLAGLGGDAA